MLKCTICEAQPSSYIDPVDYQSVCRECFFKIVINMLGPEVPEDSSAPESQVQF